MDVSQNPQVFISYAHDDLEIVDRLYADLKERGVNVWFDKESMSPGRWKTQIQKAIPKSRYFIFCVSKAALRKTESGDGFVDDELQQAYEIAMAQDERHFTIIPVRLEDAERGDHRISIFQQFDLFENWNREVDKLAVYLGGNPVASGVDKSDHQELGEIVEGLIGKAVAAYHAREFNTSLQLIELVIPMMPKEAPLWFFKGRLLGGFGRWEEALQVYEEAIRLDPEHIGAWTDKVVVLSNLGRHEQAEEANKNLVLLNAHLGNHW